MRKLALQPGPALAARRARHTAWSTWARSGASSVKQRTTSRREPSGAGPSIRRAASRPVFLVPETALPVGEGDPSWTAKWSLPAPPKAEVSQRNVVGLLPGSTKKDEYVVVSAHYDHVGVGSPVDGDVITATTEQLDPALLDYFAEMLLEKGQAKLDLRVEVPGIDGPAVCFAGSYVVLESRSLDGVRE